MCRNFRIAAIFFVAEVEVSFIQKLLLEFWIQDVDVRARVRRHIDCADADDFYFPNTDFLWWIRSPSLCEDSDNLHCRFLTDPLCQFEQFFVGLVDHTLNRPCGIADIQEDDMVVSAAGFHPAIEFNLCTIWGAIEQISCI